MLRSRTAEVNPEGDDLRLPFASETLPVKLVSPSMKNRKMIQRTIAEVFVFNAQRLHLFSRLRWLLWGMGLESCLFIEREHYHRQWVKSLSLS